MLVTNPLPPASRRCERTTAATAFSASPPALGEGLVGDLRRGVEEALAVDAEVEDVLDQAGRLAAERALVLRTVLRGVEGAARPRRRPCSSDPCRNRGSPRRPPRKRVAARPCGRCLDGRSCHVRAPATRRRTRRSMTVTTDAYASAHDPGRRRGARRDPARHADRAMPPSSPPRGAAPSPCPRPSRRCVASRTSGRRAGCGGPPPTAPSRSSPPGSPPRRAWDVAEAHRLLHGGWQAEPGVAWALAHGLTAADVAAPPTGDLFELVSDRGPAGPDAAALPDGHLRGDHADWLRDPAHLEAWARAALETAHLQHDAAERTSTRLVGTVHAESAAALMCVELRRDGLPVDRARTEELLAAAAGPRPATDAEDVAGPPRARRPRPPARPRARVHRPAQPGAGQGAARGGRRRRAEHPQVGARAVPRRPPRSSTPSWTGGATSGSRRPTATGGSTPTSAPTTACAATGPPATAPRAG